MTTNTQVGGKPVTIALLERKTAISRSLFSRYWRDVHGVMAARIPGFASYTQHHVTALAEVGAVDPEPFEGIAVVTYASEEDRNGLIHSAITPHIHRDEQNVFRRALLYNLAAHETRSFGSAPDTVAADLFLVLPQGTDGTAVAAELVAAGAYADLHDLTGADPAGWNDTDVDDGGAGRLFACVVHALWADEARALAAVGKVVAASDGTIAAYRTDEKHVMVEHGRATPTGLRGLDAVRTIAEAGAINQLDRVVVQAIYGTAAG